MFIGKTAAAAKLEINGEIELTLVVEGAEAGTNLASRFEPAAEGVLIYQLARPLSVLESGEITVSVKDEAGNVTKIERRISIGPRTAAVRD